MGKQQLHSIQALRGIAAVMVVFVHAVGSTLNSGRTTWLDGLKDIGTAGVDIFFIISGFLMVATTAGRAPGMATALDFMKSRLRRVVPLYWLLTTAMLAAIVLLPAAFNRAQLDVPHAVASYLFLPHGTDPVIFTGWTLSYEMWFYVVFAVLLLFPRWVLLPALAVFFIGSALASLLEPAGAIGRALTSPLMVEFVGGAALGTAYARGGTVRPWLAGAALALGALLLVASLPWVPNHGDWNRSDWTRVWMWGIPSLMIVAGMVELERAKAVRQIRPLTLLGDSSYSLYLSHVFVIPAVMKAMNKLAPAIPGTAAALIIVAVCVAVGYLIYALAERPMDRQLRSRRTPTPIPQAA